MGRGDTPTESENGKSERHCLDRTIISSIPSNGSSYMKIFQSEEKTFETFLPSLPSFRYALHHAFYQFLRLAKWNSRQFKSRKHSIYNNRRHALSGSIANTYSTSLYQLPDHGHSTYSRHAPPADRQP